ncbi:general substrate transporter [Schizophyllum amplum]|uniref:General substrate transporter n=1 Tax=Schizophyllum amplum TaxID=97359 RepID=A0A550CQ01_9AGAR|nr:general substrate transporter [Auriculariopsis ampla]
MDKVSLFQNSRAYWLAFVVYWGIVLFGYDTGVGGGVVSSQHFKVAFGIIRDGVEDVNRSNEISSNVVSVLQAGAFFGALGSAPLSSRAGRRKTLFLFSIVFLIGAILTTVAQGNSTGLSLIYGGRVISGFGIGGVTAVAPAYVSECAPKEVRGRITGMFQIMVAFGVMISYFVNYGVGLHQTGQAVWQIPFAIQLIPAGIMAVGLLTVKESPRWLASVGREKEALANLAYIRKKHVDDEPIVIEMAEIEAAIREEREARQGLGLKEAFLGKGNYPRFIIAFVIFLLQQWCGQNSVNYYAPQIFASIGYTGTKNSLLASGIYGVVKVVSTAIFVFFGVEWLGRKLSLFISGIGMGTLFFIIGAILKTHPPTATSASDDVNVGTPSQASQAMAAMLYIYVCFYSMGWGPLPWLYVSEIFPTRTRHFGLSLASASQWLFNFVLSKVTPDMVTALDWKLFMMFATIDIGGLGVFSLLIPETKGRSLEEMDVVFGSVEKGKRAADVAEAQRELDDHHVTSVHSDNGEKKV